MKSKIIEYIYSREKEGYLYCLHNEMYNYYGKNIYKLGCTKNITKRRNGYVTSYISMPVISYSVNIKYYTIAEKILFKLLDKYRYTKNREFFDCSLDIIINNFKKVEDIINNESLLEIIETYKIIKVKDKDNINKFLALIFPNVQVRKLNQITIEEKIKNLNLNINNIAPSTIEFLNNNENYRTAYLYRSLLNEKFLESVKNKYSDDVNLKLLDDLHKLLNIEWFDKELIKKLGKNKKLLEPFDIPDNLYNKFCRRNYFNIRSKKKPKNYLECVIFLLNRYTMFSTDILIRKSNNFTISVNKKRYQYTIPEFGELFDKLNIILEHDDKI